MKRNPIRLGVLLVVAVLVFVACGGSEAETTSEAPAVTEAPAATEAPAVTEAPAATEAPAVTEAPAATEAPAGGMTELTISAEDSEGFSTSALEAPAGEVSVTFNNQDGGTEPHNWHVVVEAGTVEYATSIKLGPSSETVTFTVDTPGEYRFFCDTHAEAMTGTLVITP